MVRHPPGRALASHPATWVLAIAVAAGTSMAARVAAEEPVPAASAVQAPELVTLYHLDEPLDWAWRESYEPNARFAVLVSRREAEALVASVPEERRSALSRAIDGQQVRWGEEALVVAYLGERRTGGYFVRIRRVDAVGSGITVQFSARSPEPGEITTQALSYPVDAVRISREKLPDGPWSVRFIDQKPELVSLQQANPWLTTTTQQLGQRADRPVPYCRLSGDTLSGISRWPGDTVARLVDRSAGLDPWTLLVDRLTAVEMPARSR